MNEERIALAASLETGARLARLQHGPVRPRWSADSQWAWFDQRHGDGHRHRLVDVKSGVQRDLFDAALLAQALERHDLGHRRVGPLDVGLVEVGGHVVGALGQVVELALEVVEAWVFRAEATNGPKVVYSNESATELVAALPGSVAFVDAGQVPKGLKILKVDGKLPGDEGYPLK